MATTAEKSAILDPSEGRVVFHDVERFIELDRTMAKRQWTRALRDWIRAELIPRSGDQAAGSLGS